MARNVQRALGIIGIARSSAEVAKCSRCGECLDFGTDALGRTIERCPACRTSKLVSATAAQADEAIARQARESAAAAQKLARAVQRPKLFQAKECDRDRCRASFTPKAGNQRFCSSRCAELARMGE